MVGGRGLWEGCVRSHARSGGCFSDQASQGGEVEPDIGLEGGCLALEVAVDGQSFGAPAFEGGVASLGGVAGAMVDAFPGWGAHGDVSHQADGVVLEALAYVDELTVGMVEIRAPSPAGIIITPILPDPVMVPPSIEQSVIA